MIDERTRKMIEEAYDKAEDESHGFQYTFNESCRQLDRMLDELPAQFWIE